jgi:hypothetical protein
VTFSSPLLAAASAAIFNALSEQELQAPPDPARLSLFLPAMSPAKPFEIVADAACAREDQAPQSEGTSALEPDPATLDVVTFRIPSGEAALEALRHARRSMLREEWMLGLPEGEPSFEEAVFTTEAIVWCVREGQRARCLEKITELTARVERALAGGKRG